ncbi:MAG TPA: glycosyltransferase family 2 protein [Terriglobia bacterium]|nr:glycosyltransferase family 2 protein [Terriglobia bacterium]
MKANKNEPLTDASPRPSRIAAVVVTYNRVRLLENCLDALIRQDRPLHEILAVNNASTDGTADMLEKKYNGTVTHVRLEENVGGAGGFYEGIRLAYEKGHDWIWVMDDDVEPMAGALSALAESPAFNDPTVGFLASLVLDSNLNAQVFPYRRFNRLMAARPAINEGSLDQPLVPIEAAGFLGGMIRREAIDAVGLPLKDLFIYWDDTEFIYRISRRFKVFLVPASKVIHRYVWVPPLRNSIFGRLLRGPAVPLSETWRFYYNLRNSIFIRTRYVKPWLAPLVPVLALTRPLGAALVFWDHKVARCKILCQAAIDGVLGRLGKRISP